MLSVLVYYPISSYGHTESFSNKSLFTNFVWVFLLWLFHATSTRNNSKFLNKQNLLSVLVYYPISSYGHTESFSNKSLFTNFVWVFLLWLFHATSTRNNSKFLNKQNLLSVLVYYPISSYGHTESFSNKSLFTNFVWVCHLWLVYTTSTRKNTKLLAKQYLLSVLVYYPTSSYGHTESFSNKSFFTNFVWVFLLWLFHATSTSKNIKLLVKENLLAVFVYHPTSSYGHIESYSNKSFFTNFVWVFFLWLSHATSTSKNIKLLVKENLLAVFVYRPTSSYGHIESYSNKSFFTNFVCVFFLWLSHATSTSKNIKLLVKENLLAVFVYRPTSSYGHIESYSNKSFFTNFVWVFFLWLSHATSTSKNIKLLVKENLLAVFVYRPTSSYGHIESYSNKSFFTNFVWVFFLWLSHATSTSKNIKLLVKENLLAVFVYRPTSSYGHIESYSNKSFFTNFVWVFFLWLSHATSTSKNIKLLVKENLLAVFVYRPTSSYGHIESYSNKSFFTNFVWVFFLWLSHATSTSKNIKLLVKENLLAVFVYRPTSSYGHIESYSNKSFFTNFVWVFFLWLSHATSTSKNIKLLVKENLLAVFVYRPTSSYGHTESFSNKSFFTNFVWVFLLWLFHATSTSKNIKLLVKENLLAVFVYHPTSSYGHIESYSNKSFFTNFVWVFFLWLSHATSTSKNIKLLVKENLLAVFVYRPTSSYGHIESYSNKSFFTNFVCVFFLWLSHATSTSKNIKLLVKENLLAVFVYRPTSSYGHIESYSNKSFFTNFVWVFFLWLSHATSTSKNIKLLVKENLLAVFVYRPTSSYGHIESYSNKSFFTNFVWVFFLWLSHATSTSKNIKLLVKENLLAVFVYRPTSSYGHIESYSNKSFFTNFVWVFFLWLSHATSTSKNIKLLVKENLLAVFVYRPTSSYGHIESYSNKSFFTNFVWVFFLWLSHATSTSKNIKLLVKENLLAVFVYRPTSSYGHIESYSNKSFFTNFVWVFFLWLSHATSTSKNIKLLVKENLLAVFVYRPTSSYGHIESYSNKSFFTNFVWVFFLWLSHATSTSKNIKLLVKENLLAVFVYRPTSSYGHIESYSNKSFFTNFVWVFFLWLSHATSTSKNIKLLVKENLLAVFVYRPTSSYGHIESYSNKSFFTNFVWVFFLWLSHATSTSKNIKLLVKENLLAVFVYRPTSSYGHIESYSNKSFFTNFVWVFFLWLSHATSTSKNIKLLVKENLLAVFVYRPTSSYGHIESYSNKSFFTNFVWVFFLWLSHATSTSKNIKLLVKENLLAVFVYRPTSSYGHIESYSNKSFFTNFVWVFFLWLSPATSTSKNIKLLVKENLLAVFVYRPTSSYGHIESYSNKSFFTNFVWVFFLWLSHATSTSKNIKLLVKENLLAVFVYRPTSSYGHIESYSNKSFFTNFVWVFFLWLSHATSTSKNIKLLVKENLLAVFVYRPTSSYGHIESYSNKSFFTNFVWVFFLWLSHATSTSKNIKLLVKENLLAVFVYRPTSSYGHIESYSNKSFFTNFVWVFFLWLSHATSTSKNIKLLVKENLLAVFVYRPTSSYGHIESYSNKSFFTNFVWVFFLWLSHATSTSKNIKLLVKENLLAVFVYRPTSSYGHIESYSNKSFFTNFVWVFFLWLSHATSTSKNIKLLVKENLLAVFVYRPTSSYGHIESYSNKSFFTNFVWVFFLWLSHATSTSKNIKLLVKENLLAVFVYRPTSSYGHIESYSNKSFFTNFVWVFFLWLSHATSTSKNIKLLVKENLLAVFIYRPTSSYGHIESYSNKSFFTNFVWVFFLWLSHATSTSKNIKLLVKENLLAVFVYRPTSSYGHIESYSNKSFFTNFVWVFFLWLSHATSTSKNIKLLVKENLLAVFVYRPTSSYGHTESYSNKSFFTNFVWVFFLWLSHATSTSKNIKLLVKENLLAVFVYRPTSSYGHIESYSNKSFFTNFVWVFFLWLSHATSTSKNIKLLVKENLLAVFVYRPTSSYGHTESYSNKSFFTNFVWVFFLWLSHATSTSKNIKLLVKENLLAVFVYRPTSSYGHTESYSNKSFFTNFVWVFFLWLSHATSTSKNIKLLVKENLLAVFVYRPTSSYGHIESFFHLFCLVLSFPACLLNIYKGKYQAS